MLAYIIIFIGVFLIANIIYWKTRKIIKTPLLIGSSVISAIIYAVFASVVFFNSNELISKSDIITPDSIDYLINYDTREIQIFDNNDTLDLEKLDTNEIYTLNQYYFSITDTIDNVIIYYMYCNGEITVIDDVFHVIEDTTYIKRCMFRSKINPKYVSQWNVPWDSTRYELHVSQNKQYAKF